jgi:hypothetical protein
MIRTAGQKDFMKSVEIAGVTTGREDRFGAAPGWKRRKQRAFYLEHPILSRTE